MMVKELRSEKMDSVWRLLCDSGQIAARVLSVVVLFYFFDHIDITTITSNDLLQKMVLIWQFLICTAVKVVIIAGWLANIAQIAVGEEPLLTKRCALSQAKRYWGVVVGCAAVPALLHCVFFIFTGRFASFDHIATACNVPLLVVLGLFFFSSPEQAKRIRRKKLDFFSVSLIVSIAGVTNYCAYAIELYLQDYFIISSLLSFGVKILELIAFIFFIKSRYIQTLTAEEIARPRLILVNPPFSGTLQAVSSLAIGLYPPAFLVLRALTPEKYKIKEYNRIVWHDQYYEGNALVGMTCLTANSAEAYKIAKEFKRRGARVVMGGPHVSIFPDEALDFCDSVVIGPAESVWGDILRDYEAGELKKVYAAAPAEGEVATVRSYLLGQSSEIVANFLETRRGCKFKCYFCANPSLQKGLDACSHSVEDMLRLLKRVAEQRKQISFIDTNIYADPRYMKGLLRQMIPLQLKWLASASIDIAADDEALGLLKDSGCIGLLVGYEIPAGSKEEERGGKLALARKYLDLSRKLKRAGIKIKGHFIYGFQGDDFGSLCRLWWFCFRLWPHVTVLSFLTPIPGSAFFEEMVSRNKLRDINWRSYNLHALVYDNPVLDNFIFRKAFSLVMLVFLGTTSTIGMGIISGCGILLFVAFRLLNLS